MRTCALPDCDQPIPGHYRADAKYHSDECKRTAAQLRKLELPPGYDPDRVIRPSRRPGRPTTRKGAPIA